MPRPRDRRVKLSTGWWDVHFINRRHPKAKGTWGRCEWDTKSIYVRYDLSRRMVIDTLLHEIAHASNEILYEAESFVTDLATIGAKLVLDILDESHGDRPATRGRSGS